MIQALAPRMPRGFSRVWLAIVVIAWLTPNALSQEPKAAPGDQKPGVDDKKAAEKDNPVEEVPTTEVFTDPNAKKALGIFAPLNYAGQPIKVGNPPDDRSSALSMASRTVNTDPDFLKRYVEFFAVELTKRENLNALLNPPGNQKHNDPPVRALERAVDALTRPIIDARAQLSPSGQPSPNIEFLNVYNKALFDSSLPKLLENNYLTRIDAMIVLGMAGSPTSQALDIYIKELKKPDQVIWVKLWAARGLTNAAQHGTVDLDALKSNLAAEALIGFLNSDEKLPWPAQMRALEALGSIRVATANLPRGKIDAASAAMKILADPDAKVEARAWAAWALGMMKVPAAVSPFNYSLIGYEVGQLAVDLGEAIVDEFDDHQANFEKEKLQAEHLTGLLLFQVYPSLVGEDGARGSGLTHSSHTNFAASKEFLNELDKQIKGICREAYELLRAGNGGFQGKRDDLDSKVAGLKKLLEKSSPKDRHLTPGGPEFGPAKEEKVAGGARR